MVSVWLTRAGTVNVSGDGLYWGESSEPRVQIEYIVAWLKLLTLIEALLPVPVAVPFDITVQSDVKLLKLLMLTPCSAFGVSASMQASPLLELVVVVVWVVVV
jgi:hypothetical protein